MAPVLAHRPRTQKRFGLTLRQTEVLALIEESIARRGWAPTLQEIAAALELDSPSSARGHVLALERKGRIVRGRGARQIRVL